MARFRIVLDIRGVELRLKELLPKLKGKYHICDLTFKGDSMKWSDMGYDFSSVSFNNTPQFVELGDDYYYQEWYVDFLERNYEIFTEYGAEEFVIFTDVYFLKGTECHFELFSRDQLKRLADYDVSLPFSAYLMDNEQMTDWPE